MNVFQLWSIPPIFIIIIMLQRSMDARAIHVKTEENIAQTIATQVRVSARVYMNSKDNSAKTVCISMKYSAF